jgi:hypothetical protein
MLNLFQHLIKLKCYMTLNQVQGDKTILFQQPANEMSFGLQDF